MHLWFPGSHNATAIIVSCHSQKKTVQREWEAYHRLMTFWYEMLKFSYPYKLRNTRLKWPDVQLPFWNFKCICVCMHTTETFLWRAETSHQKMHVFVYCYQPSFIIYSAYISTPCILWLLFYTGYPDCRRHSERKRTLFLPLELSMSA